MNNKSLHELKVLAKESGIKNFSKMNKQTLMEELGQKDYRTRNYIEEPQFNRRDKCSDDSRDMKRVRRIEGKSPSRKSPATDDSLARRAAATEIARGDFLARDAKRPVTGDFQVLDREATERSKKYKYEDIDKRKNNISRPVKRIASGESNSLSEAFELDEMLKKISKTSIQAYASRMGIENISKFDKKELLDVMIERAITNLVTDILESC